MMFTGPVILTDSATWASLSILSYLFASLPFTYFSVTAKLCGPGTAIGGKDIGPTIDRLFGVGEVETTLLLSIFKFRANSF